MSALSSVNGRHWPTQEVDCLDRLARLTNIADAMQAETLALDLTTSGLGPLTVRHVRVERAADGNEVLLPLTAMEIDALQNSLNLEQLS